MATIKAIEGRSVHQIQSGQVIVDLCSVVKELVENSLDAGATSIEVRFKASGLDAIEVQDNGAGIAPEDYDSIALKHFTSKLSTYEDLGSLNTFGFRGEALSSLCALSTFFVVTTRESDGAKGTRLDFETSGKVREKSVVASSKGTTVSVEQIFKNLPVRRKELERNIKREYQKVLNLLNAYACISTGVRFVVSNAVTKGKRNVVFSTKASSSTRENIANVFSVKTLQTLLALDLKFELRPSTLPSQSARNWGTQNDTSSREVRIVGHISRPVVGEGRTTTDRQLFFVNSRPCALPQVAKAINEVYRSFNITQSPFIFANLIIDTNAYDVNVSPDKRTILLHDQTALLEALKHSLTQLFEEHEQTVPQGQLNNSKLPAYKSLTITRRSIDNEVDRAPSATPNRSLNAADEEDSDVPAASIMRKFVARDTIARDDADKRKGKDLARNALRNILEADPAPTPADTPSAADLQPTASPQVAETNVTPVPTPVRDFNARMGVKLNAPKLSVLVQTDEDEDASPTSAQGPGEEDSDDEPLAKYGKDVESPKENQFRHTTNALRTELPIVSTSPNPKTRNTGLLPNAFDIMRKPRPSEDTATITIGDKTVTKMIWQPPAKRPRTDLSRKTVDSDSSSSTNAVLLRSLRSFAAAGSQLEDVQMDEVDLITLELAQNEDDDSRLMLPPMKKFASAVTINSSELEPREEDHSEDEDEAEEEHTNKLDNENAGEKEPGSGSDDEYLDDEAKKAKEDAKIARMIAAAEAAASRPTDNNMKRAISVLKARSRKDATLSLLKKVDVNVDNLAKTTILLENELDRLESLHTGSRLAREQSMGETSVEERLALSVSKADFGRMNVIGQFNLGFILATRPSQANGRTSTLQDGRESDELFIIDQHASDEKYNFERLQAETVVQDQQLVIPKSLDLTAVEEELVINHPDILAKNGFKVSIDQSGDKPVGRRCKLVSLPMSKEVIFDSEDLEELLALLGDHSGSEVPRPSKVRRMFAMRACRSSIMVGRTLNNKQMQRVIRHMGEIDKPWNCPHGRPTMRHLYGLSSWSGWQEGDGLVSLDETIPKRADWKQYLRQARENQEDSEEIEGEEDGGYL